LGSDSGIIRAIIECGLQVWSPRVRDSVEPLLVVSVGNVSNGNVHAVLVVLQVGGLFRVPNAGLSGRRQKVKGLIRDAVVKILVVTSAIDVIGTCQSQRIKLGLLIAAT